MIFNVKNKYQDFWKKIKLLSKCLYYQQFIISQQYMIIFFFFLNFLSLSEKKMDDTLYKIF